MILATASRMSVFIGLRGTLKSQWMIPDVQTFRHPRAIDLIESARHLFRERGFAGTSMADLLAHAGVNSGSFYHFFESKEARSERSGNLILADSGRWW